MSSESSALPSPAKSKPWVKRHQVTIAIVGAILSTTTYFGKDRAQEHWKSLATSIKAARTSSDMAESANLLQGYLDNTERSLDLLTADALSIEKDEKPHAQLDGYMPVLNNYRALGKQLTDCEHRLNYISKLDQALDDGNTFQTQIDGLKQQLVAEQKIIENYESNYFVKTLTEHVDVHSPQQSIADAENFRKLDADVRRLDSAHIRLSSEVKKRALERQEQAEKYEAITGTVLSCIFVVGLLLSVFGKITGGESDSGDGE